MYIYSCCNYSFYLSDTRTTVYNYSQSVHSMDKVYLASFSVSKNCEVGLGYITFKYIYIYSSFTLL